MSVNGFMRRLDTACPQCIHDHLVLTEDLFSAAGALGYGQDTDAELALPERRIEVGKDRVAACADHQGVEFGVQFNEPGRLVLSVPLLVDKALERVDLPFKYIAQPQDGPLLHHRTRLENRTDLRV